MSELTNFLKKKYKTQAAFDKAFGGDGRAAMKLLEAMGEASPAVNKEAQKIFRANPDDIEKGVAAIRRRVYGDSDAKTGVRGKTAAKPEVIEGNLPTNDTAVVADPPKSKGKGRGGRKRGPKKEEVAAEGGSEDANTPIGQFVPFTQDLVGQGPEFSVSTDTNDLLRGAQAMQTPTGEIDRILQSPPAASPRTPISQSVADVAAQAEAPLARDAAGFAIPPAAASAGGLDWSWMQPRTDVSKLDLSALLGDVAPKADSMTEFGPYRDGLFDFADSGAAITPPADAALPGTIAPDGGFLGMGQTPSPINRDGGFAAGDYGPSPFNEAGGFLGGDYGPSPINPEGGFLEGGYGPTQMNAFGGFMGGDYGPPPPPPKQPKPPLEKKGLWGAAFGPGALSRGNEFLYQRGILSKPSAEALAPVARVLDPMLRLGGAYVAARGIGQGLGAAANYMSSDALDAPPSDEQMSALSRELQEAEDGVRAMMQPPRKNPASAQPSTPVQ